MSGASSAGLSRNAPAAMFATRCTIAERRRSLYVVLPISEAIARRAREVQTRMAVRGHHRAAGVTDLLTAALAEYHGATVLHYDADFEHIAAVTGQSHAWIAARGSLD